MFAFIFLSRGIKGYIMENYGTRNQSDKITRGQAESVIERVFLAVESLCTGKGDVRKRLIIASGILLPLHGTEFPEDLREDFAWVMGQVSKYKSEIPQYEGNIEATMRRIKNSTGEKIAIRIFKIYSNIQDIRGFPLL